MSRAALHEHPRMCDHQLYTSMRACADVATHAHMRISFVTCVSFITFFRVVKFGSTMVNLLWFFSWARFKVLVVPSETFRFTYYFSLN